MWFIMCSGLLFGDGSPMPLCCHTPTHGGTLGGARRDGWGGGGGTVIGERVVCMCRGGKA